MPTGNSICDASLYEINCKTLTDKTACERDGYVGNCDSKCNNNREQAGAGRARRSADKGKLNKKSRRIAVTFFAR